MTTPTDTTGGRVQVLSDAELSRVHAEAFDAAWKANDDPPMRAGLRAVEAAAAAAERERLAGMGEVDVEAFVLDLFPGGPYRDEFRARVADDIRTAIAQAVAAADLRLSISQEALRLACLHMGPNPCAMSDCEPLPASFCGKHYDAICAERDAAQQRAEAAEASLAEERRLLDFIWLGKAAFVSVDYGMFHWGQSTKADLRTAIRAALDNKEPTS